MFSKKVFNLENSHFKNHFSNDLHSGYLQDPVNSEVAHIQKDAISFKERRSQRYFHGTPWQKSCEFEVCFRGWITVFKSRDVSVVYWRREVQRISILTSSNLLMICERKFCKQLRAIICEHLWSFWKLKKNILGTELKSRNLKCYH